MPPTFFLRFTFGAELLRRGARRFLRGAGLDFGFDLGRWDEADDLRRFLAVFFRRFPPNPAAICFFESFAMLPAFRPGFAMIVSLMVCATGHPRP